MSKKRSLRVPASLVAALVGVTATASMTISACDVQPLPEPVDATKASSIKIDAAIDSAATDDSGVDAAAVEQTVDARVADAPPDARPDARPDAPPV